MSRPGTAWTRDDTERWLNDYPLPKDLTFHGERVVPRYALKKGYGFWLRTAGPYHLQLRGLFALVHELLAPMSHYPTADQLAELIRRHEAGQATIIFSDEDKLPADPRGHPAAISTSDEPTTDPAF
jgi:hypothetical protein